MVMTPTRVRPYSRASTLAAKTVNLATKPDVSGMPAWARSRNVIAPARSGARLPRPR